MYLNVRRSPPPLLVCIYIYKFLLYAPLENQQIVEVASVLK